MVKAFNICDVRMYNVKRWAEKKSKILFSKQNESKQIV